MSIVRLGPIRFGWCLECNIPIVDVRFECGSCGSKPKPVSVTPPGDVRPAFKGDIELLGDLADRQFGDGCGSILFPDDKVIVLNKAPGLDRMDEVVIDGQVVCTLKFDIEKGYRLLLRLEGARRISRTAKRGRIHISADAVPYIVGGASVMVPGIEKADASIEKGDEVMVLDDNGDVIAVGFSRMSGRDMAEREKGAATKTRWSSDPSPPEILQGGKQWKDVIEGNRTALDGKIGKAIRFIHNVSRKHDLPLAVSFSGGKDSLVTLLLALDAGLKPEVIFVDTGLEFRETVDYVHALAEKMGLKLIVEDAGETFWDGLKTFGPPSKDFRWCCKSCKLGPTARLIREHFPDGVLSLIGQRRYESRSRAKKGGVWENPWVPGQVAASPVQNWTALDVWLYIFMKKADYNPWYERGMERIGCFLCPASDMAELGLIEERCEEYDRWSRFLRSYADGKGYDDRWIDMGLWRWKSPPRELRDFYVTSAAEKRTPEEAGEIRLDFAEGLTPCAEGLTMEGMFSTALDIDRVGNTMNIVGAVERDEEIRTCKSDGILIFEEGAVVIRGRDEDELGTKRETLKRLVRKSLFCVGCGVCLGLCDEDAIRLKNGRSRIDEEKCIHCGKCISPCPAADFTGEFRF